MVDGARAVAKVSASSKDLKTQIAAANKSAWRAVSHHSKPTRRPAMGSRPTRSNRAREANPRKSPRSSPKPLAGKPDWVAITKRLERALTRSPRRNLKTNSAERSKQRLASNRDNVRLFVLEISRGDMDKARLRIQGKLSLIRSTAAVLAEMARGQEGPNSDAAAILDHLIIDPLTDQIADISVLLGEKVEEHEGAGVS